MSAFISVCIPTFNRPEYLRQALLSVLAQSHDNFEVVVTDNSSGYNPAQSTPYNFADLNRQVVRMIGDRRVRYLYNGENKGFVYSANRGVSESKGAYVVILADDDLLKPTCLKRLAAALQQHPAAGLAFAPMDIIDGDGAKIAPKLYLFKRHPVRFRYQIGDGLLLQQQVLRDYLTRTYPCCVPSGIMFRREALLEAGGFRSSDGFAGDLALCMRVAAQWDFYYVDEVLASWRYTEACHTAELHKEGLDARLFYQMAYETLFDTDVQELFAGEDYAALGRQACFFASCRTLLNVLAAVRSRNPLLAWRAVKTILANDPHPTNWLRLPLWAAKQVLT